MPIALLNVIPVTNPPAGGKRINNIYPEYEMRNMTRKNSRKNARNASRKSQRGGKPMLNW